MLLALASLAWASPEFDLLLQEDLPPAPLAVVDLPPVLDPGAVPAWPKVRRRHPDATVVGLVAGTLGGVLLAAALPDRGNLLALEFRCLGALNACPIPVSRPSVVAASRAAARR